MTREHDSLFPLLIGLIVAIAAHIAAAAPMSQWLVTARRALGPADLCIENIAVPGDKLVVGGDTTLRFDVANRGQSPAKGPWRDRVYLSLDDQLDDTDSLLIDAPNARDLQGGERYDSGEHTIPIAAEARPPLFLIFVTDADHAIDEGNYEDNNIRVQKFDALLETPEEVTIGKADSTEPVSLAWISYEDFQRLIAPRGSVEQPALQNQVDPVPGAPLEMDPTAQTAAAAPSTSTPPGDAEVPLRSEDAAAITPAAAPAPGAGEAPAPPVPDSAAATVAAATPADEKKPGNAEPQTPPDAGNPSASAAPQPAPPDAKPTSVPRDEGESDPVMRTSERYDVRPGSTMTGKGITIKTARPRFSPVAASSAIPHNPEAEITFNSTGKAIDVKITKSSGYNIIDSPVTDSLYKWKASGEKIAQLKGKLIVQVRVILIE